MAATPLLLLGLAAGGFYLTYPRDTPPANSRSSETVMESGMWDLYRERYRDLHDMGMSYSIQKPSHLELTNLNEAWKPWSAPSQTPSRSVDALFKFQAQKDSYLETYGYPFYFHKNGEIPLASAQQSNPNVEIPNPNQSFRWDPKNSLAHYPRVYADGANAHVFSTRKTNMFDAGEPTESEVVRVPEEGRLNRENNPWGPGGVLQNIWNKQHETLTLRKGTDRSTILAPPSIARRRRNF